MSITRNDVDDEDYDRGESRDLTKKKKKSHLKLYLLAGCCLAAVAVVWTAHSLSHQPSEKVVSSELPKQIGPVGAYVAPLMPVETRAPVAEPPKAIIVPQVDPAVRVVRQQFRPAPAETINMASYADEPTAKPAGNAAVGQTGATEKQSGIDYAASRIPGVKSGLLGDQTFLLTPGLLSCTLATAVNSDIPGPVSCIVHGDIRPHGVTLLDDGSVIHGMSGGNVQNGQTRLQIAADWVEDRATGCFVKFDNAPFASGIGVGGIEGNVDPHSWEKFGAAMLLTVGNTGETLAQSMLQRGGNTYLSFNSGGEMQSVANTILQKQINIPPTITIPEGTPVAVFVQKVIDFSPCYGLALKGK